MDEREHTSSRMLPVEDLDSDQQGEQSARSDAGDDNSFSSYKSALAFSSSYNISARRSRVPSSIRDADNDPQGEQVTKNYLDHEISSVEGDKNCLTDKLKEKYKTFLLPEDTFSLLVFVPVCSKSFALAFSVFAIQISTLGFLMADGIDLSNDQNPLGIPESVTTAVTACQFLALLIASISQMDVVQSLNLLYNGYNQNIPENDQHGDPTLKTVNFHYVLNLFPEEINRTTTRQASAKQALENRPLLPADIPSSIELDDKGIEENKEDHCNTKEGTAAAPLKTVRQRKKTSLLSSFARLCLNKMKTCLTERRWLITRWYGSTILRFAEGALGLALTFILVVRERTARDVLLNFTAVEFVSSIDNIAFVLGGMGYFGERVRDHSKHSIIDDDESAVRKPKFLYDRVHSISLLLIFVGLISGWTAVVVKQNNGDYMSSAAFVQFGDDFSPDLGTFSGVYHRINKRKSYRFLYEENRSGRAWLGYCQEGFWALTISEEQDPCDWKARSAESTSFEVLDSSALQWYSTEKDSNRGVPIQHFLMLPYRGDGDLNACGKHGKMKGDRCQCDGGWIGVMCRFRSDCHRLSVDVRTGFGRLWDSEKESFGRRWSSEFKPYRKRNINDSTHEDDGDLLEVYDRPVFLSDTAGGQVDIIMFTGRRWGLFAGSMMNLTFLVKYSHTFHAYWANNFPVASFISEAVDVFTPTDDITPVGLEWFHPKQRPGNDNVIWAADTIRPSGAVLLCATCSDSNLCRNNGACVNGTCKCPIGAKGSMCEDPPLGNGRCDEYHNDIDFEHDGGDCCESTCVSSDFSCGKEGDIDLGYFFCTDPRNTWKPNARPILGSAEQARSGSSLALTRNAAVIAVAEPGANAVRLLFKDGSRWIERDILRNPTLPGFGSSFAMSSGLFNAVHSPTKPAPVTVVVGGLNAFWLYDCMEQRCKLVGQQELYNDYNHDEQIFVSISRDGTIIAAGGFWIGLRIFERRLSSLVEVQAFAGSEGTQRFIGHSFSGSGRVIAIGREWIGPSAPPGETNSGPYRTIQLFMWNGSRYIDNGEFSRSDQIYTPTSNAKLWTLSGDGQVLGFRSKTVDGTTTTTTKWSNLTIYGWKKSSSTWILRQSLRIDGSVSCMDLSADGSVLAVGTRRNEDVHVVQVFKWNNIRYHAMSSDTIPFEEQGAISVSEEGSGLAVGLPSYEFGRGITTTYQILPPACGKESVSFRLSLTTDDNPGAIRWALKNSTGDVILGAHYYSDDYSLTTVVEEACLKRTECHVFSIYNTQSSSKSDGIGRPGGYTILLDGKKKHSGGNFNGFVKVGPCPASCEAGRSLFRIGIQVIDQNVASQNVASWWVKNEGNNKTVKRGNHSGGELFYVDEVCVPKDNCFSFSFRQQGTDPNALYVLQDETGEAIGIGGGNENFRFGSCEDLPFLTTEDLYQAVDQYLIAPRVSKSAVVSTYGPIEEWDISQLSNLSSTFSWSRNKDTELFDEDLSKWDVSRAKTMDSMFYGASRFVGLGLSSWNVSSVKTMDSMFAAASTFVGVGLSSWNVARVTNMRGMFRHALAFNANISAWNVSSVNNFDEMFLYARSFDHNLCSWGDLIAATEEISRRSMFVASGCPTDADPNFSLTPPGPFCHQCGSAPTSPPPSPPPANSGVTLELTCAEELSGNPCDNISVLETYECSGGECIKRLIMSYNEHRCNYSQTAQGDSFGCEDLTDTIPSFGHAAILCVGSERVYFNKTLVEGNTSVSITGFEDDDFCLPPTMVCTISNSETGEPTQNFTFDVSGKVELYLKDSLGMLTIEGCNDMDCLVDVSFNYTVGNDLDSDMKLTAYERRLFDLRNHTGESLDFLDGVPRVIQPGQQLSVVEPYTLDRCMGGCVDNEVHAVAETADGSEHYGYDLLSVCIDPPVPPPTPPPPPPTGRTECEEKGASCGEFVPCGAGGICSDPICVSLASGGGACMEGAAGCDSFPPCPNGDDDCPDGTVCAVGTCCPEPNVCIPEIESCEARRALLGKRLPHNSDFLVNENTIGGLSQFQN